MNCMPFLDPDSQSVVSARIAAGPDTCVLLQGDSIAYGAATFHHPSPQEAFLLLETGDGGSEALGFTFPEPSGDALELKIHLGYHMNGDSFGIEAFTGTFPDPPDPLSVLFVGNSYTFANGGMAAGVDSLFSSGSPGSGMRFGEYAVGGATLEDHFGDPACRMLIGSGDWDLVVFQEQSLRPIEDPDLMWEYAFLLDSLVTDAGGEACFFMTWPREYARRTMVDLALAYDHAGAHLDASVAPAGIAWLHALSLDPSLDLWEDDQSHPTVAGTYLAACVFYSLLSGESPAGLGYAPAGITPGQAEIMRIAAWDAVSARAPVNWHWF